MMLGDKVKAKEAMELGMIYKVCPDELLQVEASAAAARLATMPTIGLGLTKRALNQSLNHSLEQQLQLEGELQTQASKSYDFNEGVNAFIEKRQPVFKGE